MSAKSPEASGLWEFGEFRLDGRARLLLRDGVPVSLTPKALDVLFHLVRHAGRAVSREELLDAIWPDTIVTDASLTQAVFLVRKALGETEASRYVETVPRIGYRFNLPDPPIGPDRAGRPGGPPAVAPSPGQPGAFSLSAPASEPTNGGAGTPSDTNPGAPDAGRRAGGEKRKGPSAVILAVCAAAALVAAAVIPMLLRSPAAGGAASRAVPSTPLPLLALDREIAVPPDALRILGAFDGTVVLSAPSAFYLLPADGALAASRVPLAPNEVAAAPLGGGRLLVVRRGRVVARHPTKAEETDLGALPADASKPSEGRVVASRSGRFLVIRGEEALDLLERTEKGWTRRLRARVPLVPGEVIDLGERLLAIAQGGGRSVRAWSLPDGAAVLDAPFAERQVFAVAVDDARGEVAVGGPFDSVAVFSITGSPGPRLLPRRGWTYGLAWVSDAPTLLASGQEGLTAWRNGAEPVALLSPASPGGALFLDSDFLLTLVPRRQRLAIVSYAGFPPSVRVPVGGRALWAAEHDAEGQTVFTGGRDGHLWSFDTRTLSVRHEDVHTDGLTSLARDGDLLASSSDDKTVALWRLRGPRLRSRTKAHDFLVNDLAVVEGEKGRELVTSSSDGTVRRWSWPALDLLEKIDVQALLGRPVSFHAVWPAPGVRRILAGTWNSSLLELTSRDGRWRVREFPVASRSIYRFAAVPRLGLVVAAGILPAGLHVFDLASGTLHPLDASGLDVMWAVPVPGKDEVLVVGLDGVSRYAFSALLPDATGRRTLSYRVWARRGTGAGLQTATLLPDGSLWAGTVKGEFVRFDARLIDGPPLFSRSVELGLAR
ncbi:MAG: winged helix-turn-helix domain-containing protein [Holophagales bacterium]|nr:winged helix-turn-helix domain-containing protein [Holophagales bacterium]